MINAATLTARIEGPALISFSGGRTSGYMLKHILDAHGGTLPDDVKVTFANTGKEMPETLDFVQECASRWGVHITWLEWRNKAVSDDDAAFEIVSHNSASRNGEPFTAIINKKGYLPNPITRFCTVELKIRVMRDFARSLGWKNWTNVIGLRADEPVRVSRARTNRDAWDNDMPLSAAGVTRAHVTAFWASQGFDLRLPNNDGNTPLGNCDLCFLKGGQPSSESSATGQSWRGGGQRQRQRQGRASQMARSSARTGPAMPRCCGCLSHRPICS